ncbi:MAG: aminotransferase class IV [Actinobacteria bacterium]|nr:aminotransferase class IV [Actinomycetota bacterium]
MTNLEFPYGEGFFETIKTISGHPQFLRSHLLRLTNSAANSAISTPSIDELQVEVRNYLAGNLVSSSAGRLRLTLFCDGEIRMVHEKYQEWLVPARLMSGGSQLDETNRLVGTKSLPYSANISLLDSAHAAGFDDAIRLNSQGEICETAVANLALKINGKWTTPRLESGALPGIIRGALVANSQLLEAQHMGSDLESIEAIYLLSSLKGAQPVAYLDERPLEISEDLTEKLRETILALSID